MKSVFGKLVRMVFGALLLTFVYSAGTTFAADYAWYNSGLLCNGTFDDTDCWVDYTTGVPVNDYPQVGDTAYFKSGSYYDTPCMIDTNVSIDALVIESGHTRLVYEAGTFTLAVSGSVTLEDGILRGYSGGTIDIDGWLYLNGGDFEGEGTDLDVYYDISMSDAASSFDGGTGTIDVDRDIIINYGTFTSTSGSLNIQDDFTLGANGTFEHNNGSVYFDGTYSSNINASSVVDFYRLYLQKAINPAYLYVYSGDTVNVENYLSLVNGRMNLATTSQLIAKGGFNWGVGFDGSTSMTYLGYLTLMTTTDEVIPNGSSSWPSIRIDNKNKSDLTISTAGSSALTSNGYFDIEGGTFDNTGLAPITFNKQVTLNGGTFNQGDSTVAISMAEGLSMDGGDYNTDNGDLTVAGNVSVSDFYSLLNGTGSSSLIDITGSLLLSGGDVYLYGADLNVGGSVSVTATTSRLDGGNLNSSIDIGDSLILEGGVAYMQGASLDVAFDILVDHSNSDFHGGTSNLDVDGDVTIDNGDFTSTSANLYIQDDFTVGVDGDFAHNNGSVYFNGSSYSYISPNVTESFYNLYFDKATDSFYSGVSGATDTVTVENYLYLGNGKYYGTTGSELIVENTFFWSTSFDGNYDDAHLGYITLKTTTDEVIPDGQTNLPSLKLDNTNKSDLNVSTGGSTAITFDGYFDIATGQGTGAVFDNSGLAELTFENAVTLDNGRIYQGGSTVVASFNDDIILSGGDYFAEGGDVSASGISATDAASAFYGGASTLDMVLTDIDLTGGDFYLQGGDIDISTGGVSISSATSVFNGSTGSIEFASSTGINVTDGDFVSTTGALLMDNDILISSPGTFHPNSGFVSFDGNQDSLLHMDSDSNPVLNVFNDLEFNKSSLDSVKIIESDIIVNGDLSLSDGLIGIDGNSVLIANGDLFWDYEYFDGNLNSTYTGFLRIATSVDEVITALYPGKIMPYISIDNANKTDLAVTTQCLDQDVDFVQDDMYALGLEVLGGTFYNDGYCDITFDGDVDVYGGVLDVGDDVNNPTIVFENPVTIHDGEFRNGESNTTYFEDVLAVSGGTAYCEYKGDFIFGTSGASKILLNGGTIDASDCDSMNFTTTVDANTALDLNSGTFLAPSGLSINLNTNIDQEAAATFVHNGGGIQFSGAGDSLFINDSTSTYNDIVVNKDDSSDNLYISSDLSIDGDVQINDGSLVLGGDYLFEIAGTITMDDGAVDFANGDLDIDGDFTLNGGTVSSLGTGQLNLEGTLNNVGGSVDFLGTLVMDGLNQGIAGSNSFGTLTKNASSSMFLMFEAGTTQTIYDELNLNGVVGSPLYLIGNLDGIWWVIDPQGTNSVSNVLVKDSYNTNLTAVDASDGNSIDSGNNVNWYFGDDYYWVGEDVDCAGTWTDLDCWSHSSGGNTGISYYPHLSTENVYFDTGSTDASLNTDVSINNLNIESGYSGVFYGSSIRDLTLSGDLNILGGTLNLNGSDLVVDTVNVSGGFLTVGSGTGTVFGNNLNLNTTGSKLGVVTLTNSADVNFAQDVNIGSSSSLGWFDSTSNTFTVGRDFTVDSSGSTDFNHNSGTLKLGGGAYDGSLTSGGETLNNVIIDKTSHSLGVTFLDDMDIDGSLTLDGGDLDTTTFDMDIEGDVNLDLGTLTMGNGTLNLAGDWSRTSGSLAGTGTVILDGSGQSILGTTSFYNLEKEPLAGDTLTFQNGTTQTITNSLTLNGFDTSGASLLNLVSDNPGTKWYIDPSGSRSLSKLNVSDSTNFATVIDLIGTDSLDSGNNTNWKFSDDYYWVGSEVSCDGSWNDLDCWSYTDGGSGGISYLPDSSSTVYFTGSDDASCLIDQVVDIEELQIASTYDGTITANALYSLTIGAGGYHQNGGSVDLNGSDLISTAGQTAVLGGSFDGGSGDLDFDAFYFNTALTKNSDVDLSDASSVDMAYLILGASSGGASGTFTAPSVLNISVSLMSYAGNSFSFVNNSGKVVFEGSTSYTYDAVDFYDLEVSSGTFSVNANIDIDNDLILSGGTLNDGGNQVNLAGDLVKTSGSLVCTGSFVLDGESQWIYGSNTFNNLTKQYLAGPRSLIFEEFSTQTILGDLVLEGSSSGNLSLRSLSLGDQWNIDPRGSRTISYLDVSDSNNINSTSIDAINKNILDSGNNDGWDFGYRYWVGSETNCDGTWSDNDCWSFTSGGNGGADLPNSYSHVYFDGNDTANCLVDNTVLVETFEITLDYTGTINFNSGGDDFIVDDYVQANGTVNYTNFWAEVSNDMQISGGSFGGITSGAVFDVEGDILINTLGLKNANVDFTNTSYIDLEGTLEIGSALSSGSFTAPSTYISLYSLEQNGPTTIYHNNGEVRFEGASPIAGLTLIDSLNDVLVNKSSSYLRFYSDVSLDGDLDISVGDLTTSDYAFDVEGDITIASGRNFNAGNSVVNVAGDWINNGGDLFSSNEVVFDGTGQTISGDTSFYEFTKSVTTSDTLTFEAGSTQTVNSLMTLTGVSGELLLLRSSSPGTQWNLDAPPALINRSVSYVDVSDSVNTDDLAIIPVNSVDSGNNINWDFGDRYWVGSDLDCSGVWSDSDCWAPDSGGSTGVSVPSTENDVYFDASDSTACAIDQNVDVNNFWIDSYSGTITGNSSYTFDVAQDFDQNSGSFDLNGSDADIAHIRVYGGSFDSGTASITSVDIMYNKTLPMTGSMDLGDASFVDLSSDLQLGSDELVSGTFIAPATNIYIGEMFVSYDESSFTFDANGGTIVFDGPSEQELFQEEGIDFYNITVDKSDSLVVYDPINIEGDLTLSTGTFSVSTNQVTLWGDLIKTSGSLSSSGNFVLSGGDQSISGSNTFYNLTKSMVTLETLTFEAGSTQTITNTLTLSGTSGNELELRSSSTGTEWNIDPQGTRTISYLDVEDSNNINATAINAVGTGSVNSGNNTNWDFGDRYWVGSEIACDGSFNDSDCWAYESGGDGGAALPSSSSSVYFDSADTSNCSIDQNVDVAYISLNSAYTGTVTGNSSYSVSVSNGLLQSGGTLSLNGSDFSTTASAFLNGGSFVSGAGDLSFGNLYLSYNLPRNASVDFSDANLFDINANLFLGSSVGGAGSFTAPSGDMNISGSIISFSSVTTTFDANNGTIIFDDDTDVYISEYLTDFHNITIDKDGGSTFGSLTLNEQLDLSGDFFFQSGDLDANGNQINLEGDWTNINGTFSVDPGVVFDGVNQSIYGLTRFDYLTKSVTSADTLTFGLASTQTITGALTLNGNSGQVLTLVSSSPGTQWNIDPQGSRSVSYVDVADSVNINATAIVPLNSVDSGNNVNWDFGERYWVGSYTGCDGTWGDSDCWATSSGGTGGAGVPVLTNEVYFDSQDTTNCSVNTDVYAAYLSIENGYTGTITGNTLYSWNVASNFIQSDGVVNLNASDLDVTGSLTLRNGDFESGASTLNLGYLSFNRTAPYTATADFGAATSLTVLNDFSFGASSSSGGPYDFTLPSTWMSVGGDFSTNQETVNNFIANSGKVIFAGSSDSDYSHNTGVSFNDVEISKTSFALNLLDSLDVNGDLEIVSGNLNASTHDIDLEGDFVLSGGQLSTSTNQINIAGDLDNQGGVFSSLGTVVFDGVGQSINGSNSFTNFTKSVTLADTLVFEASSLQTILGTMTLTGSSLTSRLELASSSPGVQWEIDPQASRVVDYLNIQDSNNVNSLAIDASDSNSINSGNNDNWDFGSRYWVGSDLDCNGNWSDLDCWSYTSGGNGGATLPDSTVGAIFSSADSTDCSIDQNIDVLSLNLNTAYTGTVTGNSSYTIDVPTITMYSGTLDLNGSDLGSVSSGDLLLYGGVFDSGNSDLIVDLFSYNTSAPKTASVDLSSASSVVVNENLSFGSNGVVSGSFLAPSSTLEIAGSILSYDESTVAFDANGGTVEFTGATGSFAYEESFTFNNLIVNRSGILNVLNDLDVDGDLTISLGTLDLNEYDLDLEGNFLNNASVESDLVAATNVNVAGNFVNNSSITSGNSTYIFDGTNQTISGDTTFNNFTKSVTSADTLTFLESSTQTITGTMTLVGASGNLLTLESDTAGNYWYLDPQGTRTISYLSVSDSYNTNSAPIIAYGTSSTNAGNNINWDFGDRYWVGSELSCDGSWNDTDCWATNSGGTPGASLPASTNRVYFDSADTADCDIDVSLLVNGFHIEPGYTGTITGNSSYYLIVRGYGYDQFDGVMDLNGSDFTTNTVFYLSGGDFIGGSGNTVLLASNLYLNYTSPYDASMDLSDVSLFDLTGSFYFGASGGGGCPSPTSGIILPSLDAYFGGTMYPYTGNSCVFDANNGTVTFDTSSSSFAYGGISFNNVVLDMPLSADYVKLFADMDIDGDLTINTGTLNLDAYDLDLEGDLVNNDTLTSHLTTTTDINIAGDFTNNGSITSGNSTVVLDGTDQTISGDTTFNNLIKSVSTADTLIFENGSTQTITGNMTLEGASGNLLTLESDSSGVYWYIDPQGSRTISYLDVSDSYNSNALVIDATDGSSVDSGNNVNWDFGYRYWVGSDVACDGSWNDTDCWSHYSGGASGASIPTSVHNVYFDSADTANCLVDTSVDIATLNIESGYTGTINFDSNAYSFDLDAWNQNDGNVNVSNHDITVSGDFTLNSGDFAGAAAGSEILVNGDLLLNTLGAKDADMDLSGADYLDVNGDIVLGSSLSNGSFVAPVTNLSAYSLVQEGSTSFMHSGGLVIIDGDVLAPDFKLSDSLNNLTINKSLGALNLNSDLDVNGYLSLDLGVFNLGNNTLYLSGNFYNDAGSLSGNSTVVLDGTDQSISGDTTFYNLTKQTLVADTLTFENGSTQIITGTMTLEGASGNLLSIESETSGVQWNIDPQGARTIAYLNINDSQNINATVIDVTDPQFVDGGNNDFWDFGSRYWVGSDVACDGSWNDAGCWATSSGGVGGAPVPVSTNPVYFMSTDTADCTIDQNVDVENINISSTYTGTITGNSSYTINSGVLTQNGGNFDLNGSNLTLTTLIHNGGTFDTGIASVSTVGFNFNTTLPRNAVMDLSSSTGVDVNGDFNFGSNGMLSGTFTAPASTLSIAGNFRSYDESVVTFNTNGGTVVFDGSGIQTIIYDEGISFNNLTVNKSGFALYLNNGSDIDLIINGNLTIDAGGFDVATYELDIAGDLILNGGSFTAGVNQINLAGDLNNIAGTFSSSGVVVLDGTAQSINGSNTFGDLRKQVSSTDTLTFENGERQTITGTLTFEGAASNYLNLVSDSSGVQWEIDPQGATRNVAYLNVQDSNNVNATTIDAVGTGSIDSGNNINWDFGNRYWVGGETNCDGTFDDSDCWSNYSGGSGGFSVPDSTMQANFDGGDTTSCNIDSAVDVYALWVEPAYTGTITGSSSHTMNLGAGRFLQRGGTVDLNGMDMVNSENMYVYGGSFVSGASDITVSGDLFFNYAAPSTGSMNLLAATSVDINNTLYYGASAGGATGTFTAPAGQMNIEDDFHIYSENSITFNHSSGAIYFDGDQNSTVNSSELDFYDLYASNDAGYTLNLSANSNVEGDMNIVSGGLNLDGDLSLSGDWNMGSDASIVFTPNTSTIYLVGDGAQTPQHINGSTDFYSLSKAITVAETLYFDTGSNQTFAGTLLLNGSSGNLLTLRGDTPSEYWYIDPQGDRYIDYVDVSYSYNDDETAIAQTNSVDSGNNVNWDFGDRYWVGSEAACDGSWNDLDCWAPDSGGSGGVSVPGASNDVYFDSADNSNCTIDVSVEIDDFSMSGYNGTITANESAYDFVVNSYTQSSGSFDLNSYSMEVSTNMSIISGNFSTDTETSITINNNLYVNPLGGQNAVVSFADTSYVLIGDSFVLGAAGSSGSFVASSGYMSMKTLTQSSLTGTSFAHNSGEIRLIGSGNTVLTLKDGLNNLVINKNLSTEEVALAANMALAGSITFTNGVLNGGAYDINVGENWNMTSNGGYIYSGTPTVNFNGDFQAIYGNTEFYNFTKEVSSADTLTFEASSRQTIMGAMTLKGLSGDLLSLRSSVSDTAWEIDPQGDRVVEYLDVQDSNNVNVIEIDAIGTGSVDSLNNTNWLFGDGVESYALVVFGNRMFVAIYDAVLELFQKVVPFSSSWEYLSGTSGAGAVKSMISYRGDLYLGFENGTLYKRTPSALELYSSSDVALGQFVHLAMTYDKDSDAGVKFYVNGVLDNTVDYSSLINANLSDLLIGTSYGSSKGGSSDSGEEFLSGEIDEFRISNVVRDDEYLETIFNNMSAPGSFVSLGEEEYRGTQEGGGVSFTTAMGSYTSSLVTAGVDGGALIITGNGGFDGSVDMNLDHPPVNGDEILKWIADEEDYFYFRDSSPQDGFNVQVYMDSSDNGNFVYSGDSDCQENIPVSNLTMYGAYNSATESYEAATKSIDGNGSTLIIDSAGSCDSAENLNLYSFNEDLSSGDFGLSMSSMNQLYISGENQCLVEGKFGIDALELFVPQGSLGGDYVSTLHIVIIDGS